MSKTSRTNLFRYISGVLENKKCHLYRINGVEDHLHIFTHINPSVALADLVKDIKLSTSDWIKTQKVFPKFPGWQKGYGAFTAAKHDKDRIIAYIMNQEEHHQKSSFKEELKELLLEAGIQFNDKFFI